MLFSIYMFNFVEMFTKIRISQFAIVFACLWFNFDSYVLIRTRCFAIDLYFVFDMFWNIFHQNARSSAFHIENSIKNCFYWRRSFYNFIRFTIFSYWFQNAFHIEMLIRNCFTRMTFFLSLRNVQISVSLCQCECDLSKIINFWLI